MIVLDQVTKLYKTVIGVNDISLDLGQGAWGLLGPNGSGKTTLINLILGQMRPTIGTVRLFGKNPWRNGSLLRRIGLCPSVEPNLPRVTALQWVTCLTRMHGFTASDARERAVRFLTAQHMDHAMNRPMRDYSLGMRQRVKLAQAMSHDPDLLILDEPFNGLDPVGRHEMVQHLLQWIREGRSLIIASHILHEVEAVNPSFLLVSGGRLLASGSPADVRRIIAESSGQIVIRSDNPRMIAARLVSLPEVEKVVLDKDERTIHVTATSSASVRTAIQQLVTETDIRLFELGSTDESLRQLFSALLRYHRGES